MVNIQKNPRNIHKIDKKREKTYDTDKIDYKQNSTYKSFCGLTKDELEIIKEKIRNRRPNNPIKFTGHR